MKNSFQPFVCKKRPDSSFFVRFLADVHGFPFGFIRIKLSCQLFFHGFRCIDFSGLQGVNQPVDLFQRIGFAVFVVCPGIVGKGQAMLSLRKNMMGLGYPVFFQGLCKQITVFHGNQFICGSLPEKAWRCGFRYVLFKGHVVQKLC